jgi:hypothetical protein
VTYSITFPLFIKNNHFKDTGFVLPFSRKRENQSPSKENTMCRNSDKKSSCQNVSEMSRFILLLTFATVVEIRYIFSTSVCVRECEPLSTLFLTKLSLECSGKDNILQLTSLILSDSIDLKFRENRVNSEH